MAVGAVLAALGADVWALTAVTALVSGAGAVTAARFGLKPSGSIFFIFATAAVGSVPHGAPVWLAARSAAAAAGFCILLGTGAHLLGEGRIHEPLGRLTSNLTARELAGQFGRFTAAPLLGGALGIAATQLLPGLSHSYWAMVAAAAPISAPHRSARVIRGLHRIVGTLAGVAVTALLLAFPAQPWQLVLDVIVLQFAAEVLVTRNYALALLFITPLALTMTQLGSPQPVGGLVASRAAETAIGAAAGIAVVLLGFRTEGRERRRAREAARGPGHSAQGDRHG
ncbi:FUSC family protein [Brevibacterium sp. BRM-1]|uniref:FUSC family protein n=1 Tax=Brevibacterium sp. BRM-1 TaxID=2999062 RepID=UPI0022808BC2|nr:FUSC family protein [Brevibacterium sp. BRM-1]WAL41548.1 FUSC family protein [Brevibacterium sp. BRM-1]